MKMAPRSDIQGESERLVNLYRDRKMSYQYQLIVIGSGSAGKDAALQAAREGLRTLLVESGPGTQSR
jgi:glycerol-3-phosphate dehydrogenase